jgi:hypothetical protein
MKTSAARRSPLVPSVVTFYIASLNNNSAFVSAVLLLPRKTKRLSFFLFIAIMLVSVSFTAARPLDFNEVYGQESPPPLVSTRGHFDLFTGQLITPEHNETDFHDENIPGLEQGTVCPPEIAMYIHGVWTYDERTGRTIGFEESSEIFDRARMYLRDHHPIDLIGYSWDSDTPITQNGSGWRTAKSIAEDNGPKLAAFIFKLKQRCEPTEIRIVAHSMGSRVVLSSLESLSKNNEWMQRNFNIATVHLMGAAVDDEQISMNALDRDDRDNKLYGRAINMTVLKFYNLYNPEDDTLESRNLFVACSFPLFNECEPIYYFLYEGDYALGERGADPSIFELDKPLNYKDINVRNQISIISDANMDGLSFGCDLPIGFVCGISETGDNHFGYLGFRDRKNTFMDFTDDTLKSDGAMDVVVQGW